MDQQPIEILTEKERDIMVMGIDFFIYTTTLLPPRHRKKMTAKAKREINIMYKTAHELRRKLQTDFTFTSYTAKDVKFLLTTLGNTVEEFPFLPDAPKYTMAQMLTIQDEAKRLKKMLEEATRGGEELKLPDLKNVNTQEWFKK